MNTKRVRHIRSNTDLQSELALEGTYFVVDDDIQLRRGQLTLGCGSTIEFAGGRFIGVAGSSLNLNGSQVIAAPYPIFNNVDVFGFNNDKVYAEWFNDNNTTEPHIYINRALRSANGCPVVLMPKTYLLTGTIVFPESTPSTLICDGRLVLKEVAHDAAWNDNLLAIDINVSNVTLKLNYVGVPKKTETITGCDGKPKEKTIYYGTGIRISGEVFHVDIDIHRLKYLNKGIDISPGRGETSANLQFLNLKFQEIEADKCIFIDMFTYGSKQQANTWFTRSTIHGGRVSGHSGIYMVDAPELIAKSSQEQVSGISFNNIGFEGLDTMPIRLRYATRLKFEYIRMAESLPKEEPWMDFENVSRVSFTINGDLRADKYVAGRNVNKIKLNGSVLKTTEWHSTPFNTLLIDSAYDTKADAEHRTPVKVATCDVQPFPMTKVVTQPSNLPQILPTVIDTKFGSSEGVKVLPRMLQFRISKDTVITTTGLQNFAPCIFYFYVEDGAKLTFESTGEEYGFPMFLDNSLNKEPSSSLSVSDKGLYKLTWITFLRNKNETDIKYSEWAALVQKIST